MTHRRTAVMMLTVTLSIATPTLAFAATQPRAASRNTSRDDGDSPIVRTIRSIKRMIVRALEGPMIPPPTDQQ
jgi:hypothetical protein